MHLKEPRKLVINIALDLFWVLAFCDVTLIRLLWAFLSLSITPSSDRLSEISDIKYFSQVFFSMDPPPPSKENRQTHKRFAKAVIGCCSRYNPIGFRASLSSYSKGLELLNDHQGQLSVDLAALQLVVLC